MPSIQKLITGILILFSLLIVGCMTKEPPPPASLNAQFIASVHVNPNAAGKPSPIVIRYYELKSPAVFETTDFFTLSDPNSNALGQDRLGQNEIEISPGTEQIINQELHPGTRYIGVVAAYRDLEQSDWRAVAPITPNKPNPLVIRFSKSVVSISAPMDRDNGNKDSDQSKFDF